MAASLMTRDYDLYSSIQQVGNARNLPYIAEALRGLASTSQVTIGDFGCATGLTSMQIFGQALTDFRDYSSSPVIIKHVDLPVNEWGEFFKNASAPKCYLHLPETYMEAIGRSQYTRVAPSSHFDLCYCAYSLLWLSSSPERSAPTCLPFDEVQNRTQAATDLREFLQYRLEELKSESRLIMRSPTINIFVPGIDFAIGKMIDEELLPSTGLGGFLDCVRMRAMGEWTEVLDSFPQYEVKVCFEDSFPNPLLTKYGNKPVYDKIAKEMAQNFKAAYEANILERTSKIGDGAALARRLLELYEEFWLGYRGESIEKDAVVVLEKKIA